MEESYAYLTTVPMSGREEEVICGIDNSCAIMQEGTQVSNDFEDPTATFDGDVCEEVVVQDDVTETIVPDENQGEIMYLTPENVNVLTVMQQAAPVIFQDNMMVTEEVITDDWVNSQGEAQGVELPVGEVGAEQQIEYDDDIPLPTDQDEYTASRPYPCDFCSRRFRKKANLINHMVAHQTDRPHGCNLCGARYIRKCDLMNHLKIHAYVPEPEDLEEEFDSTLTSNLSENDMDKTVKKKKQGKKRKRLQNNNQTTKIKQELNENDAYDTTSGSRSYNYVDEDMRLLNEMEVGSGRNEEVYAGYEQEQVVEARYPILDPRKPFVCQHCGVAFAREKALASHARIHAGDSPFECETCGEMFWDMMVLKEHLKIKHGGVTAGSDYDDIDDDDYVEESNYGDFYCTLCGIRFHRQDLLRRHMKSHDNVKEEYNDEDDVDYGHVCNVCGQSFTEALDLLAHAEVHARSSPGHRCMLCGELFNDEQTMANHVNQRHGKNMPPNTCMLCGKTCKDRRTLLKHSWDHSREKLFSCSKCGKSFHNKARLKRHMVSHRNKAVQCDVCGEDFPDGRSLMNHRHSHSNISGRQFPCRECGKTFGSRSSQQIHIRIHTGERPYGCRFCWKAFADGGTLRKHERIHTGEKPYACAVCPRAFNQRVVLREHIRSHHSGPDPQYSHTMTPYCCTVCNDMFSTSQDLIIHLIHHCDMNTAMKRQPQVGPRKYKRRRKLKPHELEMISNRVDQDDMYSSSEERISRKRQFNNKKPKRSEPPPMESKTTDKYEDMIESFQSAVQTINSIVNQKPSQKGRKKFKSTESSASRPKMIHTQKTRVPIDSQSDGRGRHKTKTLITRTTPQEHMMRGQSGERNRPRTKNVSYHVLQPEKFPLATFDQENENPEGDENMYGIKPDPDGGMKHERHESEYEAIETEIPDIASEETVLAQVETVAQEGEMTNNIVRVTKNNNKRNNSLTPGRHIIGPGNKVIRIVKGGMIVKNDKVRNREQTITEQPMEPKELVPTIKQEIMEPSPLHELAELSMQHAQNQFRCEMCCESFTDRSQLLMHVPIHI